MQEAYDSSAAPCLVAGFQGVLKEGYGCEAQHRIEGACAEVCILPCMPPVVGWPCPEWQEAGSTVGTVSVKNFSTGDPLAGLLVNGVARLLQPWTEMRAVAGLLYAACGKLPVVPSSSM